MLPPETLDTCAILSITEAPSAVRSLASASRPADPNSAARLPPPERATPRRTSRWGTVVRHEPITSDRSTRTAVALAQPARMSAQTRPIPMRIAIAGALSGDAASDDWTLVGVAFGGSASLLDRLFGLLALRAPFLDELVCEVVLVDVGDVGHRLAADLLRSHQLDVVEPDIGVEAALGRQLAQLADTAGARVVRGEGEQALVEPIHRLVRVILVHHRAQELDARVDVGLDLVDVAHPHVLARGRHDLHDADGADGAALALVELRFLISLLHQQQILHFVLVAVLAKKRHRPLEFRELLPGRGALRPFGALVVPLQDLVALAGFLGLGEERIQVGLELRALLANHPGDVGAGTDLDVRVDRQLGEDFLPEVADVGLGDGHLHEAGIHHLEDVLGLEGLRSKPDPHRRLFRRGEIPVECLEALVVARRFANIDFLAGKIVQGHDRLGARPGDEDLRDVVPEGVGEVDVLQPFWSDREVAHDDVATAREECRDHLVSGDRNAVDVDANVSGLEPLVQIGLVDLGDVVGDATLDRTIHEVVGLRVRHQEPDPAPLDHPIEVAGPRLGAGIGQREALGLGVCFGGRLSSGSLRSGSRRRGSLGVRHGNGPQGPQEQENDLPHRPPLHTEPRDTTTPDTKDSATRAYTRSSGSAASGATHSMPACAPLTAATSTSTRSSGRASPAMRQPSDVGQLLANQGGPSPCARFKRAPSTVNVRRRTTSSRVAPACSSAQRAVSTERSDWAAQSPGAWGSPAAFIDVQPLTQIQSPTATARA